MKICTLEAVVAIRNVHYFKEVKNNIYNLYTNHIKPQKTHFYRQPHISLMIVSDE